MTESNFVSVLSPPDQSRSGIAATETQQGGIKKDEGKLRFDLLPAKPLMELVRVYSIGAKKYEPRGWEKGLAFGRVFAAMMRHAWRWWLGEPFDQEDGQHHLASVAWCALALLEYDLAPERYGQFDDRPKKHWSLGLQPSNQQKVGSSINNRI